MVVHLPKVLVTGISGAGCVCAEGESINGQPADNAEQGETKIAHHQVSSSMRHPIRGDAPTANKR